MNTRLKFASFILFTISLLQLHGDNQTPDLSPIFSGNELPFSIKIEKASFSLPIGLQSYVFAEYEDKVLILCGRNNGLHGFSENENNFPPNKQNTTVIVLDLGKGSCHSRSLLDPNSGLTQKQIDLLSVTNAQNIQTKQTLYITGGYGVDSATGHFNTKNCLTAIDIREAIEWVTHPDSSKKLSASIRQIFDDTFQVTGGVMRRGKDGLALLVFGINFDGFYSHAANGDYTNQVRRFYIYDDGQNLSVQFEKPAPLIPDPSYRRRDLNVVTTMQFKEGQLTPGFLALSGVFTPTEGVWTLPVLIDEAGIPSMADPNSPTAFKQAMNHYDCADADLFSIDKQEMYVMLFGGISYGFFENGLFQTDPWIPFTKHITALKIDKNGQFTQHLMDEEFPVILSTASHPGNRLLFGTDAVFFPAPGIPRFSNNNVINYDELPNKSTLIGHIVGGIQSTLPNTSLQSDTAASPYIFKVFLEKKGFQQLTNL